MIRLSGRRVGFDIEVRVTGVRPGEKLVEELLAEDEPAQPTVHPAVSRIKPVLPSVEVLRAAVDRLGALATGQRDDDVRVALFAAASIVGPAASDGDLPSPDAPSTPTD